MIEVVRYVVVYLAVGALVVGLLEGLFGQADREENLGMLAIVWPVVLVLFAVQVATAGASRSVRGLRRRFRRRS